MRTPISGMDNTKRGILVISGLSEPAKGGEIMKKGKWLWMGILLSLTLAACGQEADKGDTPSGGSSAENEQTQDQGSGSAGNNNSSAADVSMDDIKAAVVEVLGEDYWPNMSVDGDFLSERYGITEDMYDDFLGEVPMISTNVDSLIVIRAKEGQVDAVESALNTYRDDQVNNALQYPQNMGKIQASRIEVIGNYVCYVQLGADVTDLMDQGEDVVITHCQEDNELAIEAIRHLVMQ